MAAYFSPGELMPRRTRLTTAKGKIIDVTRWAERQGLFNVAADLREALAPLPEPPPKQAGRRDR
jgi:hypothetical protein